MEKSFLYEGQIMTIGVQGAPREGSVTVSVGDRTFTRRIHVLSPNEMLIRNGAEQTHVFIAEDHGGTVYVHVGGHQYVLARHDDADVVPDGTEVAGTDGRMMAVMPGKVIRILVEMDQVVDAGEPVLILESMKMENTQEAPFRGRVVEINAKAGEQVDAGAVIVRLEPVESPTD